VVGFSSMIQRMLAQIRVWVECATCGPYQKLEREVDLPSEAITPMLEKTCAVCDRCSANAVMYFEREGVRLH
jgi:hypothetical protein